MKLEISVPSPGWWASPVSGTRHILMRTELRVWSESKTTVMSGQLGLQGDLWPHCPLDISEMPHPRSLGAKRRPMAQRNRQRPQPESNYSSAGPLKPTEGLCISSSTNIYLDTVPDAGERAKIKTRHCPGGVSILLCLCFPIY